ncbi:DUF3618 domain-containing protein [Nocardia blacklockiae]|uniref:DUF3618 domain-containing protein n=1 Tax=Nocardia blacklockiae TaxID=480036 RepID=UPI001895232B|nr:DUF3618 domain-containing protein [Nocardia blacklockiae]MBF6175316.1 DUF3618 domain-containing protein [Nocardia blacklockiae]
MNDHRPEHPDSAAALREDRDAVREELGRTVEELAGKFDVRERGREKVQAAEDAARATAARAKQQAENVAAQVESQAGRVVEKSRSATPDPVLRGGRRVADTARNRPVPVAALAAGAAVVVAWLIVRRR